MPASPVTPRNRWVEAGLVALAEGGPQAVRVELLAADLKVTKGGFYGLFSDRAELLGEMLDEWERRCTNEVLATVASEGGDAVSQIRRVGQLTFSDAFHRIDLAIRNWARHDTAVAKRLRRIDNRRMAFLRTMFGAFLTNPDDIEARATLAFTLAIGRHFLVASQRGRTKRKALQLAADYLLSPASEAR